VLQRPGGGQEPTEGHKFVGDVKLFRMVITPDFASQLSPMNQGKRGGKGMEKARSSTETLIIQLLRYAVRDLLKIKSDE